MILWLREIHQNSMYFGISIQECYGVFISSLMCEVKGVVIMMVKSKITIDFIVETENISESILDKINSIIEEEERNLKVKLYEVEYETETY